MTDTKAIAILAIFTFSSGLSARADNFSTLNGSIANTKENINFLKRVPPSCRATFTTDKVNRGLSTINEMLAQMGTIQASTLQSACAISEKIQWGLNTPVNEQGGPTAAMASAFGHHGKGRDEMLATFTSSDSGTCAKWSQPAKLHYASLMKALDDFSSQCKRSANTGSPAGAQKINASFTPSGIIPVPADSGASESGPEEHSSGLAI